MIYVYIVGPLFNQAEVRQRKYEGSCLDTLLSNQNVDYTIINPIELPINEGKVNSSMIYEADYQHQCKANAVFLDLSNQDTGSHTALGVMLEKRRLDSSIHLYPVISDIRLARNGASGLESSVGFNSYVIGALKANGIQIYESFEEALKQFEEDVLANVF